MGLGKLVAAAQAADAALMAAVESVQAPVDPPATQAHHANGNGALAPSG
jgi:hypothetical protein